ncbi:hypothetical protein B484DRAFT_398289 [Ochromonadaceae sp. CCMP2298]|nr:hypothetical protein B484DRAFT_398289 [Ochromonadaceae sp. CCMP2298]
MMGLPAMETEENQSPIGSSCWNCYGRLSPLGAKALRHFSSLALLISISVCFYCSYEGWAPTTAVSFAIVTLSTVGYGYHAPSDDNSRLFTVFFMLFGVYFVFAGLNEVITIELRSMRDYMKRSYRAHKHALGGTGKRGVGVGVDVGDVGDVGGVGVGVGVGAAYLRSTRKLVLICLGVLAFLVGAAGVFMIFEEWTFVKALYFAVQTTTTVGYGDIPSPNSHTRIFLCFYIIFSTAMMAFAFASLRNMTADKLHLEGQAQRARRLQNLDFIASLDRGQGVTQAEFLLAVLEHIGVIHEAQLAPWIEKFEALGARDGRIYKEGLRAFSQFEKEQAAADLEDISLTRDHALSLTSVISLAPPRRSSLYGEEGTGTGMGGVGGTGGAAGSGGIWRTFTGGGGDGPDTPLLRV